MDETPSPELQLVAAAVGSAVADYVALDVVLVDAASFDEMRTERMLALVRERRDRWAGALAGVSLYLTRNPDTPVPANLPRLVQLMLAGYVLLAAAVDQDELVEAASSAPYPAEIVSLFDPELRAWADGIAA